MLIRKLLLRIALIILVVAGGVLSYEMYETNLAHSTFERYYTFRGCSELIDKTPTYGDCRIANGQEIKIVLYKGRWYLSGDLPMHFGNITF
jgi:hypothetical protein